MSTFDRLEDYERSAAQPWRWLDAAGRLFEAAEHLRAAHEKAMKEMQENQAGGVVLPGFHMDQQAHYFEGKCIELYIKCLLIKNGEKVTGDGKKRGKMRANILSHDLIKLCGKAKFKLTSSENRTLTKLTDAVTFWGTYPIPTRVESWRPDVPEIEGVKIEGIPPLWWWTPADTENYLRLVERLRADIGPINWFAP